MVPLPRFPIDDPPEFVDGARLVRTLDVVISLCALVFALPLFLVIALAIKARGRGPILFRQRRLGLHGRSFYCLKFRTMEVDAAERLQALFANDPAARAEWARDHKLRNDPRITPIGGFLRKSSFDELPQLLNVLQGHMSLVGPRPITADEARRYGSRYWTYCTIRPGITGLWQISGRNDTSYRRRVAMDAVYARRFSVKLYLKVLVGTPPAMLTSRGAY